MAEALAASARKTPVESSLIERLVRMRPWLPRARQAQLDATIRAMRSERLAAGQSGVAKDRQVLCLGLRRLGHKKSFRHTKGRRTLPNRERHDEACWRRRCLGSSGPAKIRDGRYSSPNEVLHAGDGNGFSRHFPDVGLAIAENFASGNPPPFKLVEVVERLGLGAVHPDPLRPWKS